MMPCYTVGWAWRLSSHSGGLRTSLLAREPRIALPGRRLLIYVEDVSKYPPAEPVERRPWRDLFRAAVDFLSRSPAR